LKSLARAEGAALNEPEVDADALFEVLASWNTLLEQQKRSGGHRCPGP